MARKSARRRSVQGRWPGAEDHAGTVTRKSAIRRRTRDGDQEDEGTVAKGAYRQNGAKVRVRRSTRLPELHASAVANHVHPRGITRQQASPRFVRRVWCTSWPRGRDALPPGPFVRPASIAHPLTSSSFNSYSPRGPSVVGPAPHTGRPSQPVVTLLPPPPCLVRGSVKRLVLCWWLGHHCRRLLHPPFPELLHQLQGVGSGLKDRTSMGDGP